MAIAKTGGFTHAAKIMEDTYLKGVKFGLGFHAATEGFLGICMSVDDFNQEICTLLPNSVFFEFVKEEDIEQDNPKTYLLSEVREKR